MGLDLLRVARNVGISGFDQVGTERSLPEEGGFEVICAPADFAQVKEALEKAGFKPEMAEIVMRPNSETEFTGAEAEKMQKLLDALENLDDVQEVYTNAVIEEE